MSYSAHFFSLAVSMYFMHGTRQWYRSTQYKKL